MKPWIVFTVVAVLFVSARAALCQAGNIVVGGGFTPPVPINVAPGEVLTIFVHGIGVGLTEPAVATSIPLPTTLAGISVSLQQQAGPQGPLPVPLFAVFPVKTCLSSQLTGCGAFTGITLQIPFEFAVFTVPALGARNVAQLKVSENGSAGAAVELVSHIDAIHVLRENDTVTEPGTTQLQFSARDSVVTHADGSRVTAAAPGEPGEVLVVWAVGLGQTTPAVASGQASPSTAPTVPIALAFDWTPNAEPSRPTATAECLVGSAGCSPVPAANKPAFSGLSPGSVGLYQVNFAVPSPPVGAPPCSTGSVDSNLTVSIGRDESFDGAAICVAVSQ